MKSQLYEMFVVNWKSTCLGIASAAIAAFVLGVRMNMTVTAAAVSGLLAGLGIAFKDVNSCHLGVIDGLVAKYTEKDITDYLQAALKAANQGAIVNKLLIICLLLLALPFVARAQTTSPENIFQSSTFSLTASPIGLPGGKTTATGLLTGGTLVVTPNFSIRQTDFVATGQGWSGYFGGVNYNLYWLAKAIDNASPTIAGMNLQPYCTASAGMGQINGSSHPSFMAGCGMNWAPGGNGTVSINLFEAQWLKAPGFNNNTAVISAGPQLRF